MFCLNRRLASSVACFLFLPAAALADRLVMKNGDIINGNISIINDGEVTIEPSYSDPFVVDMAEVATVELDEVFDVELEDERKMTGQITLNDSGEQVLVAEDMTELLTLSDIAEATEPEEYFDWGANVDFTSTINNGNTDSNNTTLFAAGNIKHGDHRHLGDITFAREETNGVSTKEQDLLNYFYNYMFNEPWYGGGSFTFEKDPIRELEHRYTLGANLGRDIFDDADKFMTASIGVGYTDEEIGGSSESGAVGLWDFRYEHSIGWGLDFFHNNNLTQQFFGNDNLIIKTNTGLSFDLIDDLYATISFRYDYETEPAEGASKDDSTLQMGLGYSFE